jgi:hypothetical protein
MKGPFVYAIASLFVLVFLGGCSTFPKDDIRVQSDADPKANFSGYKTYAWLGTIGIVKDPEGLWEPPQFDADAEIVFKINSALRKRGFTEVDSNPDLLVGYALGLNMKSLKIKHDPKTELTTLENVPQTALVVMLIDPETRFAIWASVAQADYRNLKPEIAKQRIDYAVSQMFKGLPK